MYVCINTGVLNLRSSRQTTNSITVVWDPADSPNCGRVLYYIVTIVNLNDTTDRNTTELSGLTVEFSNLTNDTSYDITVAAVNRAGTGQISALPVSTLSGDEEERST